MSKQILFRGAFLPLAALALAVLATDVRSAEQAASANVDTFADPDGTNYFALSLKPTDAAPVASARDVVVLFDTSAAQTGEYRAKAIAVLKGLLAQLGPNDRVQLRACDLSAVALNDGFVAANSKEMAAALKKLDARVPLGATDLGKAMASATEAYAAGAKNARSVIYMGKGTSRANLISGDQLEALAKNLADARISVSSYVIGPQPDRQILGALAAQTGGVIVSEASESLQSRKAKPTEQESVSADVQALTAVVRGTVYWPTTAMWPAAMSEIYPKNPPLRSDRDTVVIGSFKGEAAGNVEMTVEGAAGAEKLSWSLTADKPDNSNAYLPKLVEWARVSGAAVPITDRKSLVELESAVGVSALNLAELAKQAVNSGSFSSAIRLADEALRRDPNDKVAAKAKADAVAGKAANGGDKPTEINVPLETPELNLVGAPAQPNDGQHVQDVQQENNVIKQVMQTEVNNTVDQARRMMRTDPEGATQDLKLLREKIRQSQDLNPEVKDQLMGVIEASLREAARRTTEVERMRQKQAENDAKNIARQQTIDDLSRKELKMQQLMERFNSLMAEGQYRTAEEDVAGEAMRLSPDNTTAVDATLDSRMVGYYQDALALRVQRQKAMIDALTAVESSLMPFNDNEPIVYPKSEIWRKINERKERYSAMDLGKSNSSEKKISDALKSPTQLDFIETPLSEVLDFLKDFHQIEIQLDKKALDDLGIATDTPITKNLRGISLKSALRLMLRELELTYIIKDEVLLITTQETAESALTTKVYPVADLVLPIRDPGFAGGFSGMGGMGGGMGGMGGGMGGMGGMGGGMGGMGGGFGGMGGGGMGMGMGGGRGGMFNVPPGVLPQVPKGGFQAFAVNDDLSVSPKSEAKTEAKAKAMPKSVAKAIESQPLSVEPTDGQTVDQAWEKVFSTTTPEDTAIRKTVRRLMHQHKFDEAVSVIQTALRHGQAQPWMYEAMVLAMQAADKPKEEIERAVMSAVDFADNPVDMMMVGIYLTRIGQDARAIQVFRDVAKLEPTRPEPYIFGMQAARKLNNFEALQWASTGILSQAWPKEQLEIWKTGLYSAKALLQKLESEKKDAEVTQFRKELDDAVQRDCVVVVSWTGNADIDLRVEEPSGTVCSLRNPRSSSGGVMLGDAAAQIGDVEGRSEVYVCPKGFSGTYRLLVQRVWGKVTAGRVTVDVYTHFRSKQQLRVRKSQDLVKDQTMVAFDLADGRRAEPLQDQQIANAAAVQGAINPQILGQQLANAVNPQAMAALAQTNAPTNDGGLSSLLFGRSGAVGYQPVIITLPEGANLMANAVISSDRRYVRITCVPLFSGIADVNVFNMATGENSTGQGGTGGQGFGSMFGGG